MSKQFIKRLLLCAGLSAGILTGAPAQFQVNGTAVELAPGCYGFEPTGSFSAGSVWNIEKIDLRENFDKTLRVFAGCGSNEGDHGIAFLFQPLGSFVGSYTKKMGFEGLAPSLAVELDIRFDPEDADPSKHHLSVIANGQLDHQGDGNLVSPVPANAQNDDVKDCTDHYLRIAWVAQSQTLDVYFDCELRLSYTGNLIDHLFSGKSEVFWGFTSGSSSSGSEIRVCLDDQVPLGELENVALCKGSKVTLEAPRPGILYEWSPPEGLSDPASPSPVAQPEQTTTYRVLITQECSRQFTDEVTIFIEEKDPVDLGPPDTSICAGNTLTLEVPVTPDTRYQWSTGDLTPGIVVSQPGTYSVSVTRSDCIATDLITVAVHDPPVIDLPSEAVLCAGESLLLAVDIQAAIIRWENGVAGPVREITAEGRYSLTLEHPCGADTHNIHVKVRDCREFYIPNAFSPNGDGINDQLVIYGNGSESRVVSFRIFDRWGSLLFEGTDFIPDDQTGAWDGRSRGQIMPAGTYLFVAEIELPNGEKSVQAGEINLLR